MEKPSKAGQVVRIRPEHRFDDEGDELYVLREDVRPDAVQVSVSAVSLLGWTIVPVHGFPVEQLEVVAESLELIPQGSA